MGKFTTYLIILILALIQNVVANKRLSENQCTKCHSSNCCPNTSNGFDPTNPNDHSANQCNNQIPYIEVDVQNGDSFRLSCDPKTNCIRGGCKWKLPSGSICHIDDDTRPDSSICNGITFNGDVVQEANNEVVISSCDIYIDSANARDHDGMWKCTSSVLGVGSYIDNVNVTIGTGLLNTRNKYIVGFTVPFGFLLIVAIIAILVCCLCPTWCAACCPCCYKKRDHDRNNEYETPRKYWDDDNRRNRPEIHRETQQHQQQRAYPVNNQYAEFDSEHSSNNGGDQLDHTMPAYAQPDKRERRLGTTINRQPPPVIHAPVNHAALVHPADPEAANSRKISNTASMHAFYQHQPRVAQKKTSHV